MDKRDKYNWVHMKRRVEFASHFSKARQLRCAQHLIHMAELQDRFDLLLLAHMWEHKIEDEDEQT